MINKAIHKVIELLEDPTGTERGLLFDFSRYNGVIDFEKVKEAGAWGVIIKATEGTSWADPNFDHNWEMAGEAGLYRGSYHYFHPIGDPVKQVDNYLGVAVEPGELGRWGDLETDDGITDRRVVGNRFWKFSVEIEAREGEHPGIYSRQLLIEDYLKYWNITQLNTHWFWLAQYLWGRVVEHPGPPTLPSRAEENRVVFHQTADLKPAPIDGMVSNLSVDYNRFELGQRAEFDTWLEERGFMDDPPPPEPPGEDLDEINEKINLLFRRVGSNLLKIEKHAGTPHDGDDHAHHLETTHRVVTDRPNGEKLRAWPNGSEAAMLKNGHRVKFLGQTRSGNNKLVAAEVNGVVVTGWMREYEIKKV